MERLRYRKAMWMYVCIIYTYMMHLSQLIFFSPFVPSFLSLFLSFPRSVSEFLTLQKHKHDVSKEIPKGRSKFLLGESLQQLKCCTRGFLPGQTEGQGEVGAPQCLAAKKRLARQRCSLLSRSPKSKCTSSISLQTVGRRAEGSCSAVLLIIFRHREAAIHPQAYKGSGLTSSEESLHHL